MVPCTGITCLTLALVAVVPSSGAGPRENSSPLLRGSRPALGNGAAARSSSRSQSPTPDCAALQEPAHQATIPVEGLENYIEAAGPSSGLPEVLHGIWWMDQTGYYQTRPDRPHSTSGEYETLPGKTSWYKAFPHNFAMFAPELLVTYAGSKWNNETGCYAVSRRTNQWVWANTTGNASGAPQWESTSSFVMHFCWNEAMDHAKIYLELCDKGGTTNSCEWVYNGNEIFVHPWGMERMNVGNTSLGSVATRYAVWQIVDGNGMRTKHYQVFQDFMKMRCWFGPAIQSTYVPYYDSPECASKGGYLVNLGDGTMVVGRRSGTPDLSSQPFGNLN